MISWIRFIIDYRLLLVKAEYLDIQAQYPIVVLHVNAYCLAS